MACQKDMGYGNFEILIDVVNFQIPECRMVRVAQACNSKCVGVCAYKKNL